MNPTLSAYLQQIPQKSPKWIKEKYLKTQLVHKIYLWISYLDKDGVYEEKLLSVKV